MPRARTSYFLAGLPASQTPRDAYTTAIPSPYRLVRSGVGIEGYPNACWLEISAPDVLDAAQAAALLPGTFTLLRLERVMPGEGPARARQLSMFG